MRYRDLGNSSGGKVFALVFEKGENMVDALLRFAAEQKLSASSLVGLGAFSSCLLGFFDRQEKTYQEIPVDEQVEVLNITGNIALYEGEPRLHAHVTLGRPDGTAIGGHLLEATVWPTLEIMLTEAEGDIEREYDAETELPLLKP